MEGQGRGLLDYFSITREYSIYAVYQLAKAWKKLAQESNKSELIKAKCLKISFVIAGTIEGSKK